MGNPQPSTSRSSMVTPTPSTNLRPTHPPLSSATATRPVPLSSIRPTLSTPPVPASSHRPTLPTGTTPATTANNPHHPTLSTPASSHRPTFPTGTTPTNKSHRPTPPTGTTPATTAHNPATTTSASKQAGKSRPSPKDPKFRGRFPRRTENHPDPPRPTLARNAKKRGEDARLASAQGSGSSGSRRSPPLNTQPTNAAQSTTQRPLSKSPPPEYAATADTSTSNVNAAFSKVSNAILEYSRRASSLPLMEQDNLDLFHKFFSTPLQLTRGPRQSPLVEYVKRAWDAGFPPKDLHRNMRSGMDASHLLFAWFSQI